MVTIEEQKRREQRQKDLAVFSLYKVDPFVFIKDMWGLTPQRALPEFDYKWKNALKNNKVDDITLDMFEPFVMGKHLTRQQVSIINAIKKAVNGEDSWKITVTSGHGIGKSCTMALITIWLLSCFEESQIPCTAPTETQLKDVLWAEIGVWLNKMPEAMQAQFVKTGSYIRVEGGEKWFARAKTGRKEDTEALAGVHSPTMVALIIDEASGVPDEVYQSSKGALSSPHVLQLMISNPTRLEGYFYRSHNEAIKEGFQRLKFSGLESPVVDRKLVKDIIDEYGVDSDQYRIRILGDFPKNDGVDDDGWINLIDRGDIHLTSQGDIRPNKLGVDPAGTGGDEDIIVSRDEFLAKIDSTQAHSNEKRTAQNTLTVMTKYGLKPKDVAIDNFGIGANVAQEIALSGKRVNAINVGEVKLLSNKDRKLFINPRAKAYRELRSWLKKGGQLVNNKRREDLLMIKYKMNLSGKIQIMGKKDMKKKYGKSPDACDALMLTFVKGKENEQMNEAIVCEF